MSNELTRPWRAVHCVIKDDYRDIGFAASHDVGFAAACATAKLWAAAPETKRQRDELLRALKHAIQYVDYPPDRMNYDRVIAECEAIAPPAVPAPNAPEAGRP